MDSHDGALDAGSRKPKLFYGYVIVIAAFILMLVAYGTQYSFGVFFKPVLNEFGWTRAMTSGAYSLYQALHGVFSIVSGRLSDRFGPRAVVTVCALFLGVAYLLMSQINAVWQLYLFYGVFASAGMGVLVPTLSAVARWFAKRRGLMNGIVVSGIGMGTVVVPPIANELISDHGWRMSYLFIGGAALVIGMIAAQFLKREPSQMGLLPYGVEEVKAGSMNLEPKGLSLYEALRTKRLWIICAVYFLFLVGQQTVMVHIVPHATDIGISAVGAASILSVIGGLSIFGRIGMGSVSDKTGSKRGIVIVLALITVALFWLLGAGELWMLYLFAVVYGFGYGGIVALQSPTVADLFGLSSHGVILGVVVFSATAGGAIGPLVAGRIFDVTGSYQTVFLLYAVLSVVALALATLLKPGRGSGGTDDARRGA